MKGATIWVINGPNLNLLGEREPEIYGRETLTDVEKKIGEIAEENQVNLEFFQENEEGKLVTLIQKARLHADGLLLNPGAYSHYSLAIYDALRAITIPKWKFISRRLQPGRSFAGTSLQPVRATGSLRDWGHTVTYLDYTLYLS